MQRAIFIDDDELFLNSLRRSLARSKDRWKSHFFSRPEAALDALGTGEEAVFVIDWLLPGADGLELAAAVRGAAASRDSLVYIILLTAKQDQRDAVRALDQGADDYLRKPIEPSELAARIRVGMRLLETERRAGEDKALRLESAMQAFPDGVLITDTQGRIVDINEAGLRLCRIRSRDRAIGKRALGFITRDDREKAAERFGDLFRERVVQGYSCHIQVQRKRIPVELSGAIVNGSGGAPAGFVGIVRDITERRQAEELRRGFVDQVMAAQEQERRALARELHDETGQWLGSLIAGLTALEEGTPHPRTKKRARELRHLSTMALGDIRRIAMGLHPAVLDHVGLPTALRRYAREFSKAHNLRVDIEVLGLTDRGRLPAAIETALYRIAQESLTNCARHSGAGTVSILLTRRADAVRLVIEDDGKGFSTKSLDALFRRGRGLGLRSMRERVELFGGSLLIESARGQGTALAVEIPLGKG